MPNPQSTREPGNSRARPKQFLISEGWISLGRWEVLAFLEPGFSNCVDSYRMDWPYMFVFSHASHYSDLCLHSGLRKPLGTA